MAEFYDIKMANRLVDFRSRYIDQNQEQAAVKLKIQQSTLSKYENGKLKIPFKLTTKLINEYYLNPVWLTTGIGPKVIKDAPKQNLISDLNELNIELGVLKKSIAMIEANHTYLIRLIEQQNKTIERLEREISNK